MIVRTAKNPQTPTQKMPSAFFVSDPGNRQQATGNRQQATGNRQQATGNYTHLLYYRVKTLTGLVLIKYLSLSPTDTYFHTIHFSQFGYKAGKIRL